MSKTHPSIPSIPQFSRTTRKISAGGLAAAAFACGALVAVGHTPPGAPATGLSPAADGRSAAALASAGGTIPLASTGTAPSGASVGEPAALVNRPRPASEPLPASASAATAPDVERTEPAAPLLVPSTTPATEDPGVAGPPAAAGTSAAQAQQDAAEIVPADQLAAFDWIIEHESGWDVTAENPDSGAYGLGQALPASKMAPYGSDYLTNPATQIRWALAYMNERYGSPDAAQQFWEANGWY